MELAEIGAKAFSFALIFAVCSTVLAITFVAGGVPPEKIPAPLFLPASWFAERVYQFRQQLPSQPTSIDVGAMIMGATAAAAVVQFVFSLLVGFIMLMQTISSIIPPELAFLNAPLAFVGAFLQCMIWIYMITRVFNYIRGY